MRRIAVALVVAAAFGAGDQYLGSLPSHPWATDVSLLSAPWLLVGFVSGGTQSTGRRAAVVALACTFAALAGYWAMTLSPVEGAHLTLRAVAALLGGNREVLVGALVTAPLLGALGHRWRARREALAALAAALPVCCEPVAHVLSGSAISVRAVSETEVAAGLLLVLCAVAAGRGRTRA